MWAAAEPLLPPWPTTTPGSQPMDDRLCLQSVLHALHVLHNGINRQLLPPERGFGPERTAGGN
ncbi:hypothetical protein ACIF80_22545 [Streptomyces sp. NPDC085927]|uniref:hypothetical protein n=1 Tax=Streptomyces sp. NPDC085927 TaxID=3365738 RepID=UPI0037D59B32